MYTAFEQNNDTKIMSKGEMEVGFRRRSTYEGGRPLFHCEFVSDMCPHASGLKPES